jgi:hypothetical protein
LTSDQSKHQVSVMFGRAVFQQGTLAFAGKAILIDASIGLDCYFPVAKNFNTAGTIASRLVLALTWL